MRRTNPRPPTAARSLCEGRPTRVWLGIAALAIACSVNSATGRVQFGLPDASEEIRLGREADEKIRAELPLYTEVPALTDLVERIGAKLSGASERPELPWAFRLVDDPAVNAFALPGGFVYVTRGLLAHLNGEAELAAVLAHETGHVTARHGAVALRKARAAERSIGVFRIIDPHLRHIGGAVAATAGLALLRHSREDELEADALSIRYLERTGYDPRAAAEVFAMLGAVGRSASEVPQWLSTHPAPAQRQARMVATVGASDRRVDGEYLRTIEGIMYGRDPRLGLWRGDRFTHAAGGFVIEFPPAWDHQSDARTALAVAPDGQTLAVAGFWLAPSPGEALDAFFSRPEIARGDTFTTTLDGLAFASTAFVIAREGGTLSGVIGFVALGERLVALIGFGPEASWDAHAEAVVRAFTSFRRTRQADTQGVEPLRIRVSPLPRAMTLRELQGERPSAVPLAELAVLNHVGPDDRLPAGRWVKRVEGFNPKPPS